jgi:hypothetical protein
MSTNTTRTLEKSNMKTVLLINNEVFRDVVVFCPRCKTMETLSLNGEVIEPNRRFAQRSSEVYHACGSDLPCHLFSSNYNATRV